MTTNLLTWDKVLGPPFAHFSYCCALKIFFRCVFGVSCITAYDRVQVFSAQIRIISTLPLKKFPVRKTRVCRLRSLVVHIYKSKSLSALVLHLRRWVNSGIEISSMDDEKNWKNQSFLQPTSLSREVLMHLKQVSLTIFCPHGPFNIWITSSSSAFYAHRHRVG